MWDRDLDYTTVITWCQRSTADCPRFLRPVVWRGNGRCGANKQVRTRRVPKESSCQPSTSDASHHSDCPRHSPLMGLTLRRMPCGAKEGTSCVFQVDNSPAIHR